MRRREAFEWLDAARGEWAAATFSVGAAARHAERDPTFLRGAGDDLRLANLRACQARLEVTYILRLFTEFEGVSRSYWAAARPRGRPRHARMEILVDRIAALRQIPSDAVADVHAVRELRNEIVHHRLHSATLTLDQCRSRIARFLSWLPLAW